MQVCWVLNCVQRGEVAAETVAEQGDLAKPLLGPPLLQTRHILLLHLARLAGEVGPGATPEPGQVYCVHRPLLWKHTVT